MSINPSVFDLASISFDGSQSNGFSFMPSISLDGNQIAFQSSAGNLVPNDFNGNDDIFVRDFTSGTTMRVSELAGGADSFSPSYNAMISGDGATVVFESSESGFVGNDTNGQNDVFARDLNTGDISRASLRWDGTEVFGSYDPSVSNDGRYVTFQSFDSGVTQNDFNGWDDVFVRDMQTGTTMDVSATTMDGSMSDDGSYNADISGDGQFVVFESMASNMVGNDFNGQTDIFVRDLTSGTLAKVSQSFDGLDTDGMSYAPAISDDGQYVAYISNANNIVVGDNNGFMDVFLHNRDTGETSRITNAQNGSGMDIMEVTISPDGMLVSYVVMNPADPFMMQTYVFDQVTGMTEQLANISVNGPVDFSGDSTVMTFGTETDGLVAEDFNGFSDIYIAETGIQPPPPPMQQGIFSDDNDMLDLNMVDMSGDNILDFTHAMGGSDTVVMAEDALTGMPFFGGDGNDTVIGSSGANFISGDDGNDTLLGDDGNDGIAGGAGWDLLMGGNGDDGLAGGAGMDRLFGDAGDDDINGGSGDDQMTGGEGADNFIISGDQSGMDWVRDFMSGEDLLSLDDVIDTAGSLIESFADLDTDFNGMIDGADENVIAEVDSITLDFMGGSVTLDGVTMIVEADIAVG